MLTALDTLADEAENLADKFYDLGFTKIGNYIMEVGAMVQLEINDIEDVVDTQ